MRKRAKVDSTHGEIANAFRECYWQVLSLAPLGNGVPDLLVKSPGTSELYLIECKTAEGKLRDKQETFANTWPVHVIRSADGAYVFMRRMLRRPPPRAELQE